MNLNEQKQRFANHIATLSDYGNIKILDFKAPDTNVYRIRFVFEEDYCKLHISGDLGELTASNYDNMTYEGFKDFVHNPCYFREKIDSHSRAFFHWDEEAAREELRQYIIDNEMVDEVLEKYDFWDTEDDADESNFRDFLSDVFNDFSESSGIGPMGYEKLNEVLDYDWENIDMFGKQSTGIVEVYLMAFELATAQLAEKETRKSWLIMANKSDCGDMSVYKFFGTEDEAFKRMQCLMVTTCINAGESRVDQMITDGLSGYIHYVDEEREDFRCISIGQITPIETADGFDPEPNWDAFPESFNMGIDEVNYAIFDVGRE